MERAIQMNASFLMHRDPVRACFCKRRNELIRIFDHQVAVERYIRKNFAERSDYGRSDGEVRHKVPVHHVKVQNRAAAVERSFRLGAQLRKICRQYRGCQFNDGCHGRAPPRCTTFARNSIIREDCSLPVQIDAHEILSSYIGRLEKNAHFVVNTETVRRSLLLWRASSSRRITSSAHSGDTASLALRRIASRKLA